MSSRHMCCRGLFRSFLSWSIPRISFPLGPVSLERPKLNLAPGLTIAADIADHGDVTLVGLLRQSIAQAQAQPDHLPTVAELVHEIG